MWKVVANGETVQEHYTAKEAFAAASTYSKEFKITTRVLKPGEESKRRNNNISRAKVLVEMNAVHAKQKTKAAKAAVAELIELVIDL